MFDRRQFVAGLAGTSILAAPTVARAQAVNWDLSTVWPDGNFHTVNAKKFAEEVKAATGGAVNITVKSGGQLGFKGPEHLRAVRDGLVPIADVLNIQQIGDEPILGAEGIPFLVGSVDELRIYHKHIRPVFERVVQNNNQKNLYIVPWPTQYLHLKVKADTLAGLAGQSQDRQQRAMLVGKARQALGQIDAMIRNNPTFARNLFGGREEYKEWYKEQEIGRASCRERV